MSARAANRSKAQSKCLIKTQGISNISYNGSNRACKVISVKNEDSKCEYLECDNTGSVVFGLTRTNKEIKTISLCTDHAEECAPKYLNCVIEGQEGNVVEHVFMVDKKWGFTFPFNDVTKDTKRCVESLSADEQQRRIGGGGVTTRSQTTTFTTNNEVVSEQITSVVSNVDNDEDLKDGINSTDEYEYEEMGTNSGSYDDNHDDTLADEIPNDGDGSFASNNNSGSYDDNHDDTLADETPNDGDGSFASNNNSGSGEGRDSDNASVSKEAANNDGEGGNDVGSSNAGGGASQHEGVGSNNNGGDEYEYEEMGTNSGSYDDNHDDTLADEIPNDGDGSFASNNNSGSYDDNHDDTLADETPNDGDGSFASNNNSGSGEGRDSDNASVSKEAANNDGEGGNDVGSSNAGGGASQHEGVGSNNNGGDAASSNDGVGSGGAVNEGNNNNEEGRDRVKISDFDSLIAHTVCPYSSLKENGSCDACQNDERMCNFCWKTYHENCRVAAGLDSDLPVCYQCHPSNNSSHKLFDEWMKKFDEVRATILRLSTFRSTSLISEFFTRWNQTFQRMMTMLAIPGAVRQPIIPTIPETTNEQIFTQRIIEALDGTENADGVRKQMLSIASMLCVESYSQHRNEFDEMVISALTYTHVPPANPVPSKSKTSKKSQSKRKKTEDPSDTNKKVPSFVCLCCNEMYVHPFKAVTFKFRGVDKTTHSALLRSESVNEGADASWKRHSNKETYSFPKQLQQLMIVDCKLNDVPETKEDVTDTFTLSLCRTMLTFSCRVFMSAYLHKFEQTEVDEFYFRFACSIDDNKLSIKDLNGLQNDFYIRFNNKVKNAGKGLKDKLDTIANNSFLRKCKHLELNKDKDFPTLFSAYKQHCIDAVDSCLSKFVGEGNERLVIPSSATDTQTMEKLVQHLMTSLFEQPLQKLLELLKPGEDDDATLLKTGDAASLNSDAIKEVRSMVLVKMRSMARLIVVHFMHVKAFVNDECSMNESSD